MNAETRQFVFSHLHDDVRQLALQKSPAEVDLRCALQQIEARQLLAEKVPSWATNADIEFPPRLSVEQCSSEATARYKSGLLSGSTLVDLTGGMGIDCHFLSQNFATTDYVEREPHLVELATRNFAVLGDKITTHLADSETFLQSMDEVDAIFIDPARRDAVGRKTVSIADCTPNVAALQNLLLQKAKRVLVKLSPMLDIALLQRELRHIKQIHVVATGNECKEVLALLERDFVGEPTIFAVNLPNEPFCFLISEEKNAKIELATSLGRYLYEPNVALMKAGAFRSVAAHYSVRKLHINSHLYTSDELISDFRGRIFQIDNFAPFDKKIGTTLLLGIKKANLAVRNFPLSVAELRKKLHLTDGGEIYLFATTLANGEKVVVKCRKVTMTIDE